MTPILERLRAAIFCGLAASALVAGPSAAGEGMLLAMDPWVREAPPAMKVHAAYMVLTNPGPTPLTLVAVESPQYKMAELHLSKVQDGIATMTRQGQITIPAGGKLVMAPGGFHVMLMHPKAPMKAGAAVKIMFKFADGRAMNIDAPVRKAADRAHKGIGSMDHGKHKMN
jgi:copper(I)-binding protein